MFSHAYLYSNPKRLIAGLATVALVGLPLSACGSESESSSSESSSSSKSAPAPKPVASIDELTGETTAIKLDKGFTDALTALKLTPGVVGDAKLEAGSLVFPITGGNVSVFKPGSVPNYVVGQIQHEGSGLSLAAGGTKVELTNLNVDPGVSRVYGDVSVNGKTAVDQRLPVQARRQHPEAAEGRGFERRCSRAPRSQISEVAAPLLNDTFKTDAVKPGLPVGIAKITVATQ